MNIVYDMSEFSLSYDGYFVGFCEEMNRFYILTTKRKLLGCDFAKMKFKSDFSIAVTTHHGKEVLNQYDLNMIWTDAQQSSDEFWVDLRNLKFISKVVPDEPAEIMIDEPTIEKFRVIRDSEHMIFSKIFDSEKEARSFAENTAKINKEASFTVVKVIGTVTCNGLVWN